MLDSRNLLTVWQANYTYQWGQVGHDWYKPLFHAAVPLLLPGDVTSELVQRALEYSTPVRQMSPWQKLLWAVAEGCRMQNLGAVVWEDVIKPLLSWEAVAALLALMVLVAIPYVGEVVLVGLMGVAIYDLFMRVVGLLRQYYEAALAATTVEELREAGRLFSQAVVGGLLDVLGVLAGSTVLPRLRLWRTRGAVSLQRCVELVEEWGKQLKARLQSAGKLLERLIKARKNPKQSPASTSQSKSLTSPSAPVYSTAADELKNIRLQGRTKIDIET